jgi:hypothetical protein
MIEAGETNLLGRRGAGCSEHGGDSRQTFERSARGEHAKHWLTMVLAHMPLQEAAARLLSDREFFKFFRFVRLCNS